MAQFTNIHTNEVFEVNTKEVLASIKKASDLTTNKMFLKEKAKLEKVMADLTALIGEDAELPASYMVRYNQIDKAHIQFIIAKGIEEGTPEFGAMYVAEEKAPKAEVVNMVEIPAIVPVSTAGLKGCQNFEDFKAAINGKSLKLIKSNEEVEVVEYYEFKESLRPSVAVKTAAGKRKDYYIDVAHRYLTLVEA